MDADAPRLQIVSDLHLEWYEDGGRALLEGGLRWDEHAQALVLAGDIGNAGRRLGRLEQALRYFAQRFPSVLYVPGNHEFYDCRVPEALDQLRTLAAQLPRVALLEPGVVARVGDRRVVGATLWFPDGPDNILHQPRMTDFSVIRGFEPWVYEQNRAHVAWLEEAVQEGDVVVTHHLPSARSISARHAGDPLNCFFLCDMERLIQERRPALWAHGHTHDSCRYAIGPTQVACNPLGYPGEQNPAFVDGAWPAR